MSEHYFTPDPSAPHRPREIAVAALGLALSMHTDAGVFSSDGLDPGSRLLIESLPPLTGRVADLGCGWGHGRTAALKNPGAEFFQTDINARAVTWRGNTSRETRQKTPGAPGGRLLALSGPFQPCHNPRAAWQAGGQRPFRAGRRKSSPPGGSCMPSSANSRRALGAEVPRGALFKARVVIERGGGYWVSRRKRRWANDDRTAERVPRRHGKGGLFKRWVTSTNRYTPDGAWIEPGER
jgi:hypothetical protein